MSHGGTGRLRRLRCLRRPDRVGRAGTALLLVLGLGAGLGTGLGAAAPATAAEADVLVRQTATLTTHLQGAPVAGTPPHRQLTRVDVDVEVQGMADGDPTYFPEVDVQLAAEPDTWYDDDAEIFVAFGHRSGSDCQPSHSQVERTSGSQGSSYHIFGYTPDYWGGTPDRPWECVMVVVRTLDGEAVDGMVGGLVNTYESPEVSVGDVTLLGKSQKRLRLVRNTWTTIHVEVGNSGPVKSTPLTLTASGKGLKVRKVPRVGVVDPEGTTTVAVRVRPTRKKAGPLRLRVRGPGISTSRKIRVKVVKAPRKPRAGRYRSKDGAVTFRIRGGKVVGFNVRAQTRCGGFGSPPTYTQDHYDFPRTKIPRNGIVEASKRGKAMGNTWSTHLRMRVSGKKVTRGRFDYGTAGPCTATVGFTAKRIGR